MPTLPPVPAKRSDRDTILVLGEPGRATLDLLRLAVLRSDTVLAVVPAADAAIHRFAEQFAIDLVTRAPEIADLRGAAAVLVALANRQEENRFVRAARAANLPIHVAERPLVSDFTALAFLEQHPFARLAA